MKKKLSVTLDESLLSFVDAEDGASRSDKIESIVRRYRDVIREVQLRKELAESAAQDDDDDAESEAWRRVMEESAWSESGAATSGPSRSRRSRNRGQH